ncbi:MAG: RluA family pseudouridine synthase [Oscillospiraceae bacterium]|jgi:RluA family pseudouridine synthase|nr:RluA family pseudouridine synthase [Oscillospiraceae bacterium]
MAKSKKEISFQVSKPAELLSFLMEEGGFSRKDAKALLSHDSVVVGRKIQTKYNYMLKKGQTVTIDYSNRFAYLREYGIDIIFESDEMVVINKPCGLLSVNSDNKLLLSAHSVIDSYLKLTDSGAKAFVVHRLDKDTSGVLLFAKSEKLKRLLQNDWNERVKERRYCAVTEGVMEKKEDVVISYLKQDKNNMVYESFDKSGEQAITNYRVIAENGEYSLLDIAIATGKKNQIRVCMKGLGHPIIGDKKYGGKKNPLKRMALHACKLSIVHPITGELLEFQAPTPKSFAQITAV